MHGGVTIDDIKEKVQSAIESARLNKLSNRQTVLFLDEANTTDAIGLIKEVMVDKMLFGKPLGIDDENNDWGLKVVAACNPYRK